MSEGLYITRRRLCIAGVGMLGVAALGLAGCSSSGEEVEEDLTSRLGFGELGDTTVRTYPVSLKIYVDSNIKWIKENSTFFLEYSSDDHSRLEQFVSYYRTLDYRGQVSFDFVYVDPLELLEMAREGFPDGDGIIALGDVVTFGCESGTIDGGDGECSVRDLGYPLYDKLLFVRAKGSGVEMPAARMLTGEGASSGYVDELQQLPYDFDGLIGIADPETTTEGKYALQVFSHEGLYTFDEQKALLEEDPDAMFTFNDATSSTAGTFVEGLAEKIVFYPDEDAAIEALVSSECQISFALESAAGRSAYATRYSGIEQCYLPKTGTIDYHGSALTGAPEPGVMRDFLELMVETTW